MVTCMGLIGVLSSLFFVRHIDRRVIVLVGVGACGMCQLAFAIAWTTAPETKVAGQVVTAFISLFTFFYVAYGKTVSYMIHPLCQAYVCSLLTSRATKQPPTPG